MPHEDVCLAAEQHDIGWHSWEEAPVLDAETGLPQEFFKVPPKVHIRLWREGVSRARGFGRYPALLVSLHADTIYKRYFDYTKASPEDVAAVRAFLDEQHRFQAQMAQSLRKDPKIRAQASPEIVERNRLLIAAVDWISLEICWGVITEKKIPEVPMEGNHRGDLILRPGSVPGEITLDPWPFREASLTVHAEGKRLPGCSPTQTDLVADA